MRLLLCECRKTARSAAFWLLAAVSALLAVLLGISGNREQFFMVAAVNGGGPEKIGGAIGFIVNCVDPARVGDSVLRTVFAYTIFWIPVSILFAACAFSSDFTSRSVVVSRARGVSPVKLTLAKTVVLFLAQGLCYGGCCLLALLVKAGQSRIPLRALDADLFSRVLGVNLLLLFVFMAEAILLFALLRSAFASVLTLLLYHLCVLSLYPSAFARFGDALGTGGLFYRSSPVYYLMNSCALRFDNAPLSGALCYSIPAISFLVLAAAVVMDRKEV